MVIRMKKLASKWYMVVVFGFLIFAGLIFALCGENSIIAVHDNLDLFIPQFQMMKDTGSFWAHDVNVPFLGGISRDVLPSEFSLYTLLYMILPAYPAYITGYLLKVLIAVFSCILLAKDFCGDSYEKYQPLVWLLGLAYGALNVFPAFGIPFASIPLAVYLLRRIYREPSWKWYIALFFYPLLSYFSYFGLFLLAYMAAAWVWLWIRDKKFPLGIFLAVFVLAAGCIACEYRLFGTMLLGDEATIRSTMEAGSYSAGEILRTMLEGFAKGMFHAESLHTYLVLPVCMVYFVWLNVSYIRDKNAKGIFHDVFNFLMLALVFNSVIYGIYYWEPFRGIIETICPPLTGWQFNRTIFFNPFVWYAAFFLVLMRLYDMGKERIKWLANGLAAAAVLLIVLTGSRYNDLYHTCFDQVYRLVKGQEGDSLSFGEFYSKELFEEAKEDIGYCGQWSAAYGFYPATLEYNGISTIDGYLGFYSQLYKDEFRKVIAPALDRVEESREYFDDWGARAYLYSGTDLSIVSTTKSYQVSDCNLYIDIDAFKALGGRYLFSRIELANAQEAGLTLAGVYTHEKSPYTLYVYQTISRYQSKEHSGLTFDQMQDLTYDRAKLEREIEELSVLAEEASETEQAVSEQRVLELYESVMDEFTKLNTCQSITQIAYYQNVLDEENAQRQEEITEDSIDLWDELYSTLREVCCSPYREAMETVIEPVLVEAFMEYEEMTEEEKELYLRENSLEQEYETAAQEDYFFEYNGEEWNFDRLMLESDALSQEEYIDIYQGIYHEKNSVLGEIYLELVDIRNQRAELEGYDNYGEYSYDALYVRDYSVKEAKELFDEIRTRVVPLVSRLSQEYYSKNMELLYHLPETTGQERFALIRPYLEEIDPEMAETFDYMEEHQLYDIDPSEGKADTGFTSWLNYFNDAFIFDSPYSNYYDYTTVIHEFGHFHYMFRNTEDIMIQSNNIDLCEIHSQGLEMLFYDYHDELLEGEAGELFQFIEVYQMIDNIVNASLLSEFELKVYEDPDMSLEELNKLYLSLSESYGIYYNQNIRELYTWVEVPHIFNSPCYYIGYATSAFSALDILTLSKENRHEAVEKYMELTTLPTYAAYCEAIEYVELQDIFEKGVPAKIVREAAELLLE
ncbi:MAG: DUF6044 family protein [Lachnospiraceae bacterium]|nr:DUF6044 family protein [Lachnospiraceae bacterium]